MAEVTARRVKSWDALINPGQFMYTTTMTSGDNVAGMVFVCPCGCRAVGALQFVGEYQQPGAAWNWNGNIEQPTLHPSVLKKSDCRWHGWLEAGVWKSV